MPSIKPNFMRVPLLSHNGLQSRPLCDGPSIGMTMDELLRITDPDEILGLWVAAEALRRLRHKTC